MITEVAQSSNAKSFEIKRQNLGTLSVDFEQLIKGKIAKLQTTESNNINNTIPKSSQEDLATQTNTIFSKIEMPTEQERLQSEAEFKMKTDYMMMLSEYMQAKYPYGSVITSDNDGNITGFKVYREDGSCYQEDPSKLSNILTSKDLNSILSTISEDDLKKYCSAQGDSIQAFVDLLKKYDEEQKFDENIHKKLSILPEQLKIHSEAMKKRAEEEAKAHWWMSALPQVR